MPKGKSQRAVRSQGTIYCFHLCPCGWECVIDKTKDEKRAEKLKNMRVKYHHKRCEVGRNSEPENMGTGQPKMNGSHMCGNVSAYFQSDVRKLLVHQFPEVKDDVSS